ncbi:MAG: glycosyltransferase family 2 protein [Chitinophagaceae bacterium]
MVNDVSIVVLTPARNEEWILEKFLQTCSMFADLIIVADQQSTDNTKAIIGKFEKAVYLENTKKEYDEVYRQRLLIEKARELVPGKRLLIAIDADEVISADSINADEWREICSKPAGTSIYFKKPDLLPGCKNYVDYSNYFLLGFMDDGTEHTGTQFHSPRVPAGKMRYNSDQIRFMHLALVREKIYLARQRLYAVMENINGTASLRFRYRKYSRKIQSFRYLTITKKIPAEWLKFPHFSMSEDQFDDSEKNGFNRQIIEAFAAHGEKRFYFDDIWYVNYNDINHALGMMRDNKIKAPGLFYKVLRSVFITSYASLLSIKKRAAKK